MSESTLTQRKVNPDASNAAEDANAARERKAEATAVSEEEMEPLPSNPSGEGIAQDKPDEVFDGALKDINPRWRNWLVRFIYTMLMLGGFGFVVYLGKHPLTVRIYKKI